MKLVFIYGPPAAGKYTTGQEIVKQTGFKLFHNHVSVPVVCSVFSENSDERTELLKEIRLMVLTQAAKQSVNTIFTVAYSGSVDDDWVRDIVDSVEQYEGEVCFVELYAPSQTLMDRVENKSRKDLEAFYKPTNKDWLLNSLNTRDHYASVKYPYLTIDTTKSSAKQSACQIIEHFKL